MAFHFYIDISNAVSYSLQMNRPLLSFPRVTVLDTVLARFILHFLTACVTSAIIIGGVLAVVGEAVRLDLGAILSAVAMASLLGLAVGALNCVLFVYSRTWQQLFNILNRPLFIISGIFFTFEGMPREVQNVLWWNPLVHVTAIMRAGFYPIYEPEFTSPAFVLFAALTPLMIAILLFRVLRARLLEKP